MAFSWQTSKITIHIHVSLTVQSRTLQTSVSMVNVNVCDIALGLFAVYLHLDIGMNLLQTSKLLKHLLVSRRSHLLMIH